MYQEYCDFEILSALPTPEQAMLDCSSNQRTSANMFRDHSSRAEILDLDWNMGEGRRKGLLLQVTEHKTTSCTFKRLGLCQIHGAKASGTTRALANFKTNWNVLAFSKINPPRTFLYCGSNIGQNHR